MKDPSSPSPAFAHPAVNELKRKSVRGGVAAVCAQGAKFVVQTATTMLLARLLTAEDFGLVGMAAALIGFVALFKEAGLAAATVQRLEVTQQQISTLFWINVTVGIALSIVTAVIAPVVVAFYGEPRLYWITVVSGAAFLFGGLAAQHQALIAREMRFVTLAKIDLLSLAMSSLLGVVMAFRGWHYWALVGMALSSSIVSAAGVWLTAHWVPGLPRRKSGVTSMLNFGWLATCTNIIVFVAWNCDNILLGRFWGAEPLGLYGRAFQLATSPIQQLNAAVTGVAFSALSRIQDDSERLARSFLRGYFLLLSLTVPITIIYPLFAEEIVRVVLGPHWMDVAPIFRLLTPTALVFAVANPFSLLVMARGHVGRSMSIAAATTPLVILGIALGLSYGPQGVALGDSLAMALLIIPIAAWSKRGTTITWTDLWRTTKKPLLAGLLAGGSGLIVKIALGGVLAPIALLLVGIGVVFGVYAWALLIAMGEKNLYFEMLSELFGGERRVATSK